MRRVGVKEWQKIDCFPVNQRIQNTKLRYIEPQTVDGKTVIVVSVEAGKNRPYYLKSKGKENGTYIRIAGTSRQAFPEKIKELEMEGARISWDELTCVGYPVSEEATEKLRLFFIFQNAMCGF